MKNLKITAILLFIPFFFSCEESRKNLPRKIEDMKEPLMEVNKNLIKADDEKINRYIERHGLEMSKSGTGLRYKIFGLGSGENAKTGQFAKVDYKVSLLDGTTCYTSTEKGPEDFLIGMDNVESGLHEGITYMKVGQKAKFILPPHLAHGLIGDKDKIPARAVIVYDIELLSLR
jgi:FKBP-type peptidyl-prolyl cis-trans isomerase FkpA